MTQLVDEQLHTQTPVTQEEIAQDEAAWEQVAPDAVEPTVDAQPDIQPEQNEATRFQRVSAAIGNLASRSVDYARSARDWIKQVPDNHPVIATAAGAAVAGVSEALSKDMSDRMKKDKGIPEHHATTTSNLLNEGHETFRNRAEAKAAERGAGHLALSKTVQWGARVGTELAVGAATKRVVKA